MIRRQPFSVVLLDEFEKAHPNVWDLFLQAFDDARMTDARGHTVSLRHVVFVMTSNVGAREAAQGTFGFRASSTAEDPYQKALRETFRPEFLNRIDQIVTFRPFTRAEQRALLELELKRVLSRRGLKDRPWAVEWEESAIDLLLSHGLTDDLGARPLRRAVERYALTPIARELLAHPNPHADQFLFVRGEAGAIVVDFVDPAAEEEDDRHEADLASIDLTSSTSEDGVKVRVPHIVLKGSGRSEEFSILVSQVERLEERLESPMWREERKVDLDKMSEPGFWQNPDRLPVLATAELRDRIDSGTSTARSLVDRLRRAASGERDQYPAGLIRRLALQMFLLDHAVVVLEAGLPQDAVIRVQPIQRDRESPEESRRWSQQLREMITNWAEKRNMQLEELPAAGDGEFIAAVSGFASWRFLEPLQGIHELEQSEADRRDRRLHARISVAPHPLGAPPRDRNERARQAVTLLDEAVHGDEVVRRYRLDSRPKIVDLKEGWRCDQPEEALAGNFDLVSRLTKIEQ